MKFGVVIFPGSNCDHDMIYVLRKVLMQEVVELWHKETDLRQADFIILPGGFSYGDYLRSGAIARFTPIMTQIIAFAGKGGFLLGICNGFQILCEAGLLPGALLANQDQKFTCKNVFILPQTRNSLLTAETKSGNPLKIPVAHGEGRYYADDDTLKRMAGHDQILFKYCNHSGEITTASNPNGSLHNIAGICNSKRNVFGMMPHPERASDQELHNTDGRILFESILKNFKV